MSLSFNDKNEVIPNTHNISQPDSKLYAGTHLMDIGKKLYLNTKTADIHFSFDMEDGSVKRVAAHKSVLAAASDVFEEMFYGESKVKGDVDITDASDAAFVEFLQFFYLPRAKLTIKNIADVMHLGHKYNVPNCMAVCVRFLKDVLTVDNIFVGLNLAILYDHKELMKFCENLITLNSTEVFKTSGFLECDQQALAHILKIDVFSCSEAEVFEACMDWVRAKNQQNALTKAMVKKHLGDLYYEIRFTSMTMQELCSLQAQYESVLRNDFANITNMIVQAEFQAENFCIDRRNAKWDASDVIKCDCKVKNSIESPYKLRNIETTAFSTTTALLLGSFVCGKIRVVGSSDIRDLGLSLTVTVEIFEIRNSHDTNTNLLLSMEAKLQSNHANYVLLTHPVLIRPSFRYKICIGPFPDEHVYYSEGLEKGVHLSYNFAKVKLHKCKKGKDNKMIGLVSCLNFNSL